MIFVDEYDASVALLDAIVGKRNHLFRLARTLLADNQLNHANHLPFSSARYEASILSNALRLLYTG
jgi:hypothetical protein